MGEEFCGNLHFAINRSENTINIEDAWDCVDRHNRTGCEFGSFRYGRNLWWGHRFSEAGKINNVGFVIGLRNFDAGIAWRLDFDENKGAHVNQHTRIPGQKRWKNLVHPIKFPGNAADGEYWVKKFWRRWTEENGDNVPAHILDLLKYYGISFRSRQL